MTVTILTGDCRDVLATLPTGSVQSCVTSPPYFGLRDYQVDRQIGLEQTPDAYVAEMVAVFREVRRVLADNGVVWLNLGDSYAGSMKGSFKSDDAWGRFSDKSYENGNTLGQRGRTAYSRASMNPPGLKPKDLLMIPARVALALQADGWWLRSDVIWHKPNPMPESADDRPTSAHEHVFLLSKRANYFYDAEAIAEPAQESSLSRLAQDVDGQIGSDRANGGTKTNGPMRAVGGSMRNARNVWTIATQPLKLAHFATMPSALVERCIKAGTSERGQCPTCWKPWMRQTTKGEPDRDWQRRSGGDVNGEYHGLSTKNHAAAGVQDASAVKARILAGMAPTITTGWKPTCSCPEHIPVPQTVLDPFAGAGTTMLVASRLKRSVIGIELNPTYATMARNRVRDDCPMFSDVAAE